MKRERNCLRISSLKFAAFESFQSAVCEFLWRLLNLVTEPISTEAAFIMWHSGVSGKVQAPAVQF